MEEASCIRPFITERPDNVILHFYVRLAATYSKARETDGVVPSQTAWSVLVNLLVNMHARFSNGLGEADQYICLALGGDFVLHVV